MTSKSRTQAEPAPCGACHAEVIFNVDSKTGALSCPECGARQRRGRAVSGAVSSAPSAVAGLRPRAGRRVVDVDSTGSTPRKAPVERTRAQARHVQQVKRELSSHRPTSGALDGTGLSPSPSRAAVDPSPRDDAHLQRWRELTHGLWSRDGRPYRVTDSYAVDDVVLHSKYGMGIVESVEEDGEITALFRKGPQSLPSGQGGVSIPSDD